MTEKEYKNTKPVEGKIYCKNCLPIVLIIIGELTPEKIQLHKDADTWYATEKAKQIAAQCPKSINQSEVIPVEEQKEKAVKDG